MTTLSIDERIRRKIMPKRPMHHSITDWDFSNADWTLDGVIYHDAAPSLNGAASGLALIKDATTGALSDGRFIGWLRASSVDSLTDFFFRNQVADGNADYENAYYIRFEDDRMIFMVYVAGEMTEVDIHNMTWNWSINTWYKIRVTWWTSAARLYVRVERWTGTEWVTLGGDADTDFEDVNDRWKDAAVNRVGVFYNTNYWADDLEVWG